MVSDYLAHAGLTPYLDALGFNRSGTGVPRVSVTPARAGTDRRGDQKGI